MHCPLCNKELKTIYDKNRHSCKGVQPSAASAGYRLLTEDDTIGIGDEFLGDDCQTWETIKGGPTIGEHWMIGKRYNRNFFQPMRRQIRR